MAKKMIVTNLRMEENDYLQAKRMAAEMGMSLNEYFNYLSRDSARREVFGAKGFFEAMMEVANMKSKDKGLGLSEEDEAIYG